ncbi:MAG: NAD-dependent epimerase/dehydratase family protein, partial [Actinobacteria bacterium]|nr:NAD-dependent epimerase/dehydratase family protein [Actinomycetota bacterium]
MIRKYHQGKVGGGPVVLWGSGTPRREFLHVDDVGEAVVFALENVGAHMVPDGLLNVGCGEDLTIRSLAEAVQAAVGYRGATEWDTTKPDGTPRKLLDIGRISALGWRPSIALEDGLRTTYHWFREHQAEARV